MEKIINVICFYICTTKIKRFKSNTNCGKMFEILEN